ncbi:MAG: AAA family ATPase [Nocardiopsaceae bacterium]|nr:AAA family ATPase [Nocardiopsaceae bacterium]
MSHTAAQRPAGRLPAEPTSFVGRVTELAHLRELLEAARLVTITGPGGVGKTRLALRAAADAESGFDDGVRLIELSALHDPELLANTVSAGLGLPEQDPRPRLDQVLDYLRERRLLLILDTCEHLVDACALFAEAVLDRTERVTVLATSRQPLLVSGEHEYPLSPLEVPQPRHAPDADPAGTDAVDLFAQRAADAVPGFEVAEANRAEVARLCGQLDGMPLAIELAAVRLRDLSLTELAERLDGRFLDATGSQDGPVDRHRTLRDAIGWSYALCTPDERALWERLAVFAGPVSAEAVQQVCAGQGLDRDAVLKTLFGLVDKSVLIRVGGDSSRYRMLDTIREYGGERLAASGAESGVRARHLRRYLALADELDTRLMDNQVPKSRVLQAEHGDIRAALEYAITLPVEAGNPALRLATNLGWHWQLSGRFQEGQYWLTRALERAPEPGPDRARGLIARSFLACGQGESQLALADAEEAVAIADDLRDRRLKARALTYYSFALFVSDRAEDCLKTAAEATSLFDHEDELTGLPTFLAAAASYAYMVIPDPEGCLRHCERALRTIPADSGERWATGYLYTFAGLALSMLGRPDEGNKMALRGLALERELWGTIGWVHCLAVAALVANAQSRSERAAWMVGAIDPLWEKYGSRRYHSVDAMGALTDQVAQAARVALGDGRYDEVVRDARSRPIDEILDMALADLDELPALPPGPARR